MNLADLSISLQKDPQSHKTDYFNLLTHYTTLIELPSVNTDYLCAIIDTLCASKQHFPSDLLIYIAIHLRNTKDSKVRKALLNQLNSFTKKSNELILLQLFFAYKKVSLKDINSFINAETVCVMINYSEYFVNKELIFMSVCHFFYENTKQSKVKNVNLNEINLQMVQENRLNRFSLTNEIREVDFNEIEKLIYKPRKEIKTLNNEVLPFLSKSQNDLPKKEDEFLNVNLHVAKRNSLNLIIKNLFHPNEKFVLIALEYTLKNVDTFLEGMSHSDSTTILSLLVRSIKKKLESKEIRFMKAELILKLKNYFGLECSFLVNYLIKCVGEPRAMELIIESVDDINLIEVVDLLFEKVIFKYQDSKRTDFVIYGLNILREIDKNFEIVDLIKERLDMVDQKELPVGYAVKSILRKKDRDINFIRKKMNKKERMKCKKVEK